MEQISAVFFDLDHTLWDLDANATLTLFELYDTYDFANYTNLTAEDFDVYFKLHNKNLWVLYENGEITKQVLREKRFELALNDLGIPIVARPTDMWNKFLTVCPTKSLLMPHALETLELLKSRFPLTLITNGFSETQRMKLAHAGLSDYFKHLVISEEVGFAKPSHLIFEKALSRHKIKPNQAIMVGDSFQADILGAHKAGIPAIWYKGVNENLPENVWVIQELYELHTLI